MPVLEFEIFELPKFFIFFIFLNFLFKVTMVTTISYTKVSTDDQKLPKVGPKKYKKPWPNTEALRRS